jgi:hypothetical protein
MVIRIILFPVLLLAILPRIVAGQVSNEELKAMRIASDLERESRPFRSGSVGPEVDGDPYLWAHWGPGSVTLYRESKTFPLPGLKLDVLNHGIDIFFEPTKIKSLDGNLVQTFEYRDSLTRVPHLFVNAKDFTREGTPLRGFLEVLCAGKVNVFAYVEATLLKPNYNMAIGSGNKNYQISKKRTLFCSVGPELLPLKKKELSKLWGEREAEMARYLKVNNLNYSRERDLILMVSYFKDLK